MNDVLCGAVEASRKNFWSDSSRCPRTSVGCRWQRPNIWLHIGHTDVNIKFINRAEWSFCCSPGARKTREWTTWHEVTRVENAGVENAARFPLLRFQSPLFTFASCGTVGLPNQINWILSAFCSRWFDDVQFFKSSIQAAMFDNARNPLDTFPRSFPVDGGSCQLVTDLLWGRESVV